MGVEELAVDDSAWDGARAMAACSTAAQYRQIAFERANDSDPDTAAHWALPHHYLGKGPNVRGVAAAIAALNGARGGAPDLKNNSRARSHLEGHQSQTNPQTALQTMKGKEVLTQPTRLEASAEDGNVMVGYATLFDHWIEMEALEGPFRQKLMPGSFTKTLRENGDNVRVFFNHGRDPQLGERPLGKPKLIEARDKGLWTETPLDQAWDVQNLIRPRIESGSLNGMSITFEVKEESWDWEQNPPERTIKQVQLYEFGPVTWPAIEATTAVMQSKGFLARFPVEQHIEAVSPEAPGRDTSEEEAVAPEDEGRDTSVRWLAKSRVALVREDLERQRKEIEQWLPRKT